MLSCRPALCGLRFVAVQALIVYLVGLFLINLWTVFQQLWILNLGEALEQRNVEFLDIAISIVQYGVDQRVVELVV